MSWIYIEREQFVRMCEKIGISPTVREAIKLWAPTVSRFELSRQKLVYRSPKNRYEAWSAGIPNPDSNKGKSGGYRIVYFLDLTERTINLDFIAERKELGFRDEGHRRRDRYNIYINELKEYLKKQDA
jgi:mRNA-degrading endonuclease RelE of RelBE toxin-antitoxin system